PISWFATLFIHLCHIFPGLSFHRIIFVPIKPFKFSNFDASITKFRDPVPSIFVLLVIFVLSGFVTQNHPPPITTPQRGLCRWLLRRGRAVCPDRALARRMADLTTSEACSDGPELLLFGWSKFLRKGGASTLPSVAGVRPIQRNRCYYFVLYGRDWIITLMF